jgi:hypothetical protein
MRPAARAGHAGADAPIPGRRPAVPDDAEARFPCGLQPGHDRGGLGSFGVAKLAHRGVQLLDILRGEVDESQVAKPGFQVEDDVHGL